MLSELSGEGSYDISRANRALQRESLTFEMRANSQFSVRNDTVDRLNLNSALDHPDHRADGRTLFRVQFAESGSSRLPPAQMKLAIYIRRPGRILPGSTTGHE